MALVFPSPLHVIPQLPDALSELHKRESDDVREVALDQRTIHVLESGVVIEFQLPPQVKEHKAYGDSTGSFQTVGIAGFVLYAIQREGAQVLFRSVPLVDMYVSGLDRFKGRHLLKRIWNSQKRTKRDWGLAVTAALRAQRHVWGMFNPLLGAHRRIRFHAQETSRWRQRSPTVDDAENAFHMGCDSTNSVVKDYPTRDCNDTLTLLSTF